MIGQTTMHLMNPNNIFNMNFDGPIVISDGSFSNITN